MKFVDDLASLPTRKRKKKKTPHSDALCLLVRFVCIYVFLCFLVFVLFWMESICLASFLCLLPSRSVNKPPHIYTDDSSPHTRTGAPREHY